MLEAYLDASGDRESDPVIVVAGFVRRGWDVFEERWRAFLAEYELDCFHAAEFWARESPPYKYWSDEKHDKAVLDVVGLFVEFRLLGTGVGLNINSFRKWRVRQNTYVSSDPYYFCLDHVLHVLVRGRGEAPDDGGVAIYCDREANHDRLELADWRQDRLRQSEPGPLLPRDEREVTTVYGSKRAHVPLQAADIFAHSMFQYFRGLAVGHGPPRNPFFLAIQNGPAAITYLRSVKFIETDFQARITGAGVKPSGRKGP